MSIQNYSQSPSLYLSGTRWSMLKKSILAHTCSHSHFWYCVSALTIFPLSAITAGSGCHAGGTAMVRHVDTIDQLGSWSKKCSIWFVQHVHMSLYVCIIYINMYANPMLIFALFHFMIKYFNFNSILLWNYNLINRKSAIACQRNWTLRKAKQHESHGPPRWVRKSARLDETKETLKHQVAWRNTSV